jgi:hypothetical protein
MTLRLVLISLVAGLGLGLPTWPTVEGWVAGAQKWMNVRLAAADHRAGERHVVIHDLLAAEMQRAHAARQAHRAAAAPALAPRPTIIAVAHTTAPRRLTAAPAAPLPIFLPKLDDYLTAAASTPSVSAVRPDDLAAMAWDRVRPEGARLAATLAEGLRQAADRDRDRDARAFLAMEATDTLYFDADADFAAEPAPLSSDPVAAIDGPEPVALEGPLPLAIAAVAPTPLPGFDAMEEGADIYFATPIVDEPPLAPEAILAEAPAPAAAEATIGEADLPADVFAPDMPAAVAIAASGSSPAPPEVNQAVRLTRDALSAWINVLTGPALLTAAHDATIAR